ncbi:hypothetical protein CKM354_001105200 [Cercospora kikuchii]|uniref:DUF4148 domain-containing protein n=1 Tax=Cercospora kikuchii TaxID=84275 RepID=A0A9P3CUT3_9PEZI|nr:uncharacterized protein CKM354_001105200 [Cercospora kikuchii]GIZ47977.1 hypothetical protein CKM354_001105200 [Cercospora kikuchii]
MKNTLSIATLAVLVAGGMAAPAAVPIGSIARQAYRRAEDVQESADKISIYEGQYQPYRRDEDVQQAANKISIYEGQYQPYRRDEDAKESADKISIYEGQYQPYRRGEEGQAAPK